jgi:hypothetical protein
MPVIQSPRIPKRSAVIVWARASEPRVILRGRIGATFSEIADEFKKTLT